LDARSKERYQGEVEEPRPGLRKGHIPTARSTPFSEVLNGGKLKDPAELSGYFATRCPDEKPVIAYCGSGVTACIVAWALEVAGHSPARIYDGSWSEWGA
jgi:thiosulfate/3-mercaptopyruvate sulfurtransferase